MKLVAGIIDARLEVDVLRKLVAAKPMNPNNFRRPVAEAAIRIGIAKMLAELRVTDPRTLANVRAELAAIRRASGNLNRG